MILVFFVFMFIIIFDKYFSIMLFYCFFCSIYFEDRFEEVDVVKGEEGKYNLNVMEFVLNIYIYIMIILRIFKVILRI